ncbi:MAG: MBL fold metallo-hydrolase, partial [Lachnospiraceae bacterium]|nr:MBL fold metallo-hydrolase [Lachnospiraceae bacterium]
MNRSKTEINYNDTAAAVPSFEPTSAEAKEATEYTKAANESVYDMLDFDDESEKENALKGLLEAPERLVIYDEDGNEVWNVADYSFASELEKAPDTVNPSLFRNTLYNSYAGLFEVCDGIYQVRGYDMANATFIRTDNGWVVFDVLMCREDMEEAKTLMEKHFGQLDIKAVLYSHSHIDHYGGIYGLINKEDASDSSLPLEEQLKSGKVVVFAPEGFLKYAVAENIYAGTAMGRRAQYQYGTLLKAGPKGKMAIGIGLGQALGHRGLLPPTYTVSTNETVIVDGLEIRFQLTPGTEAPAEMNAYFPKYRGLWLAENCNCTMHNIYTLRGAEVRNAADW